MPIGFYLWLIVIFVLTSDADELKFLGLLFLSVIVVSILICYFINKKNLSKCE